MHPAQLEAIVNVMKAAEELTRRVFALEETLHKGPDPSAMAHSQGGIQPRPELPAPLLTMPEPILPAPAPLAALEAQPDQFEQLVTAGLLSPDEAELLRHKRGARARLESSPAREQSTAGEDDPFAGRDDHEPYRADPRAQLILETQRRERARLAGRKIVEGAGEPDKPGLAIGMGQHVSYSKLVHGRDQ